MDQKTIDWFEYMTDCFEAEKAGKQLQLCNCGRWDDVSFLEIGNTITISGWHPGKVRIKPQPPKTKQVPLDQDDLPWDRVVWVRTVGCDDAMITGVSDKAVKNYRGESWYFVDLFENNSQWSTDRKTWNPFYKEVTE